MRKAIKVICGALLTVLAMLFFVNMNLDARTASSSTANLFDFPVPVVSGTSVRRSGNAVLDYSNVSNGYVMARFTRRSDDVRVLVTNPGGVRYQYRLNTRGEWEVFPLTGGNGRYVIQVVEGVGGGRFSVVINMNVEVTLIDEFAPFLRPNQFVNFNRNSAAVAKAAQLTRNADGVLESVAAIYDFVITNIEYDVELARTVQSGYVPNIDLVLERGKGICFDYAALMTAMLRSRGIPTKLVIGYAGTVFHAWISVYSPEHGWIDNIIHFDGEEWHMMDPTFAATSGNSDAFTQFIGDGTNYNPTNLH